MRFRIRWALSLVAISLLAACGQSGPTTPSNTYTQRAIRPATPVGGTAPALSPAPGAQPQDLATQQLIARSLARLDAIKTIQGKVLFDEFKDGKSEHGEAKFTFRAKPYAARVDVLQSNRAFAGGSSMLWTGGTTLKIKPIHMPFTLDFAYDNGQVVSLRGYRIDQTDLFSMAKVLRAPGAQIRPVGPRHIGTDDFVLLDVVSPASCKGITHEIIGLNQRLLIPTYREMYEGDRLVHRGQGQDLVFDHTLPDDAFNL